MDKYQSEQFILRSAAEIQLFKFREMRVHSRTADELLDELEIHQIELKMQNNELLRRQEVIEDMRDRYMDLYEFAPVGYLTLTHEGKISEINMTGEILLGMSRDKLINRPFARFARTEDCDKWHLYFKSALLRDSRHNCELTLQHNDGTLIHVIVGCMRKEYGNASFVRIALTDITEHKNLAKVVALAVEVEAFQTGHIKQADCAETENLNLTNLIATLTPCEIQILNYIGSGRSSQDIARQLSRSIKTIEKHRANMRAKLHLKDGAALMRYAALHIAVVHSCG